MELQVDGSAGKIGCRAGIILKNPEGLRLQKEVHFNFQTTNNVAEYEALLAGLNLDESLKIRNIIIKTDSQLVANQVQGLYEVKEQNLKDYKEATLKAMNDFDPVKINLVKREYIEEAVLAKLSAAKSSSQEKWNQVSSLASSSV